MKGSKILLSAFVITSIFIASCSAFMHGYTEDKAIDKYLLVTGNKDNFGDRRIKYNKGFHRNSSLTSFLNCKGLPNLIYEYKSPKKTRGIKLYYTAIDSVFIFEEPKKGQLRSVFKEARKIEDHEKLIFEHLKNR